MCAQKLSMGWKSLICVLCFLVRVKVSRKKTTWNYPNTLNLHYYYLFNLCKSVFTPAIFIYVWPSVRISFLWSFMIIRENHLFLFVTWESMSVWKYAIVLMLSSWTYRLSSKTDNDILLISYVPNLCFLLWIILILCLIIFLLNKVSLNSLN